MAAAPSETAGRSTMERDTGVWPFRWTTERYHRLLESGIQVGGVCGVELLGGEVYAKGVVSEEPLRWTCEHYHQLVDAGVLGEDDCVQLVGGELLQMAPQKRLHGVAVGLAQDAFEDVFRPGYHVQVQTPVAAGDGAEPEPDVAVIPGRRRDYLSGHPASAVLVYEVSDTTLGLDRHRKGSLYAKAGIPDYWLLNLNSRQLEVYRGPMPMADMPFGFGYQTRIVVPPDGEMAPLAAPDRPVKVADLLP